MTNQQVITAFSDEQVARLTGISVRQLRYWDETDFIRPEYAWEDRSDVSSRIYSYLELVSLKVIARLRKKVPLQRLRLVKEHLSEYTPDLWRGLHLWVDGQDVAFYNPATGNPEHVVSGQKIMEFPLADELDDLEKGVQKLFARESADIGQIVQRRRVLHNKRVVAGTRIPVSAIKAFSDAGYSIDEILAEYPALTADDVRAALNDDEAA